MPLSPGDKLGAYEIVSSIGKGGMGEVWKARDPQLGRNVAIKVSAQQFTDRLELEARAIAALNPSNKRAHIWAFGVVLYQMLAARRLFEPETIPDSFVAILKKETDLALAPMSGVTLVEGTL